MKKYLLYVGMMLVLLFGTMAVEPAAVSEGQNIRFSNEDTYDAENTEYTFVNQIPDPAEPGGLVELRWKVENFGGTEVDNLLIELLPEFPFSLLAGDDGKREIGSVHARQIGEEGVVLFYRIKVDEDAVEGKSFY